MTHGAKYQVVTNASGTLITDTTHIGHRNPIRYRGYYYDVETGLYYLQSRYYDPKVGRFISADGIMAGIGGNDNGYNLFAYCFNNPVNYADITLFHTGTRIRHGMELIMSQW